MLLRLGVRATVRHSHARRHSSGVVVMETESLRVLEIARVEVKRICFCYLN